jgi:CheY-like chemotaxis protein
VANTPTPRIFLCYRRGQTAAHTGRIHDRLRSHFGDNDCFVDINSIPPGVDFREYISASILQCRVVLAVIGPNWVGKTGSRRRIDDPKDFVRLEIEIALERKIPVIPILIDGAGMPTEANLPPSLARLSYCNAVPVDQGPDFGHQVDRLIKGIERLFVAPEPGSPARETAGLEVPGAALNEPRTGRRASPLGESSARTTGQSENAGSVVTSGSSSNRSLTGSVLIVDDDGDDRKTYRDLLLAAFPELTVETAPNALAAIAAFGPRKLDVVVADMILDGNMEAGYETLLEMKNMDPGVEVIAFTRAPGYGSAVRCMRAGCLDYVDKGSGSKAILERVERAIQLARSGGRRRLLIEQLILANWDMVQVCTDQSRHSRYLANLLALLFGTIPNWSVRDRSLTNDEEFDLVISNELDDSFWIRRGNFILVKCRNRRGGRLPQRSECDAFVRKIERGGSEYCRLGIFVSMRGVTTGFEQAACRPREGRGPVIIVIDGNGIWELICAPNRGDWLKDRVQERVFG